MPRHSAGPLRPHVPCSRDLAEIVDQLCDAQLAAATLSIHIGFDSRKQRARRRGTDARFALSSFLFLECRKGIRSSLSPHRGSHKEKETFVLTTASAFTETQFLGKAIQA